MRTIAGLLGIAPLLLPASPAGAGPLPEGAGLAASYPGDEGIERDERVLFADGFETVRAEVFSTGYARSAGKSWNHRWDMGWGRCVVTNRRADVHGGRAALEAAFEVPASYGLSKFLDPGRETVFLRYYIKYDEAFPGAHHVGGSVEARAPGVPHANPGVKADGRNKFSVLLDHWSFEEGMTPPGPQVVYCYHMDQQHRWGEQFYPSGKIQPGTNMHLGLFGPEFTARPDFTPDRGRWICCEVMVRTNRPGERDGRIAFWIDGRLAGDFPNLRLRAVDSLKADRVDIGMYGSRENGLRRVWFDDVVVATDYVGPRRAP